METDNNENGPFIEATKNVNATFKHMLRVVRSVHPDFNKNTESVPMAAARIGAAPERYGVKTARAARKALRRYDTAEIWAASCFHLSVKEV